MNPPKVKHSLKSILSKVKMKICNDCKVFIYLINFLMKLDDNLNDE